MSLRGTQQNSTAGSDGCCIKAYQNSLQLPTVFHRLHTLRQRHIPRVEPGWHAKAANIRFRTSVGTSAIVQAAAMLSPETKKNRASSQNRNERQLSSALYLFTCST